MKRKNVTLKDIAVLSGVSRATVSAVLHGSASITERTRLRVLETIREHDYQPRLIARSLLSQFARLVGVVVRDINNPCFTEIYSGLSAELRAHGYNAICHSTEEAYDEEVKAVALLRRYRLGGYVIAAVQEDLPHDHLRKLVEDGTPLVTIGRVPGLDTYSVDMQDRSGSRMAAEYLLARGHRRITCLAGPATSTSAKERVMGFIECMLDHCIDLGESQTIRAGSTSQGGYEAALKELAEPATRPTAVLCFNDLVAIGVYKAAHELGLRIPDDLSVVGFDDIETAQVLGPALTTVALHSREIGVAAAELLLSAIQGQPNGGTRHRLIETTLVERDSVKVL